MRQLMSIIVLVAILGISFSSCKQKTRRVKKKVKKVAVVKQEPISKDTVEYKEEVEPVVVADPNKYFIIAASFQSKENAEAMVSRLIDLGYQSRIFESADNFYRVSYMSFTDKNEALRTLEEERSKEDSEDVWLHIPKNLE